MKNTIVILFWIHTVFNVYSLENIQISESETIQNKTEIDSIYNWFINMQNDNGLLLSSEGGRYVSLYDNALSALVFTINGDFENAEKIFDFFESRIENEMLVSPGGFGQMRTINGIPIDNRPRRWLGDNAWLLIAINNYHNLKGNNKYQHLATTLSNWIISLQDDDGGIWGGFKENGDTISKIAEGNIDAFNAIPGYNEFHKKLLVHLKNVRWDQSKKVLIAWADHPKYEYALDLHSWGFCIFENFPKDVLSDADRFLTTQKSTISNQLITGYCFDEDKDVVWLEGTGQMATAFNTAKMETEAQFYLQEMRKNRVQSIAFPNTYAFPYTVNHGTSFSSSDLWNGVDTNPSISSTAWYLFGMLKFDPLELGRKKNVPQEDKFWLKKIINSDKSNCKSRKALKQKKPRFYKVRLSLNYIYSN